MVCTNVSDVVKEQKEITLIQKNDIKIVLIKQKSIYVKNSTIEFIKKFMPSLLLKNNK